MKCDYTRMYDLLDERALPAILEKSVPQVLHILLHYAVDGKLHVTGVAEQTSRTIDGKLHVIGTAVQTSRSTDGKL